MDKIGYIKFSDKEYKAVINCDNQMANMFIKHLPIISEAQNIGGEIYFRANGVDIEYDGTQTNEFDVGDIVYWRSPLGNDKYAIAIFYGNTKYSGWKTPRASSPCVKIGEIVNNIDDMDSIKSGETVKFILE